LNATGSELNATTTGFFVNPIRQVSTTTVLYYNPTTAEITHGPAPPNPAAVYSSCVNSLAVVTMRSATSTLYGGSGFFVALPGSSNYAPSNFGYIATAAHNLVDPATSTICSSIHVFSTNPVNSTIEATVLGIDKIADVGLLRIPGSNYEHLQIGNSRSELSIGNYVNVLGYPMTDDIQSFARGIIRDKKFQKANYPESVLTDAAIYNGNSGGPMINDSSRVVGIASFTLSNNVQLSGGVASHLFQPILEHILNNYTEGTFVNYPKGYLGIEYQNVGMADILNNPSLQIIEGVKVTALDPTVTPARFSTNDVITEVEGVRVGQLNSQFPFATEIHLRSPTSTISVKYRPWDTGTSNYLAETTKSVELAAFNPALDIFSSNVHNSLLV
jgi:S1-C subfamily serine protease